MCLENVGDSVTAITAMVLTATLIPGASYASGTFTIPWTALNTILPASITAADNIEKLIYALLQVVYTKQTAATPTVSQSTLACEISAKQNSLSTWEFPANTFSQVYLTAFLVSLPFTVNPGVENGSNILAE